MNFYPGIQFCLSFREGRIPFPEPLTFETSSSKQNVKVKRVWVSSGAGMYIRPLSQHLVLVVKSVLLKLLRSYLGTAQIT